MDNIDNITTAAINGLNKNELVKLIKADKNRRASLPLSTVNDSLPTLSAIEKLLDKKLSALTVIYTERVENIETEYKELRIEFEELKKQVNSSLSNTTRTTKHGENCKNSASILNSLNIEKKIQEGRKNNVVISGVPISESEPKIDDQEIVKEIICTINSDITDVTFLTRRVGKITSSKFQKIVVTFSKQETRDEIIQKANTLRKNSKWNNIYINPDLTQAQAETQYNLRCALRNKIKEEPLKIWTIYREQIIEKSKKLSTANSSK